MDLETKSDDGGDHQKQENDRNRVGDGVDTIQTISTLPESLSLSKYSPISDTEMELCETNEPEDRAEVTFLYKFDNFSKIFKRTVSTPFIARTLEWRVLLILSASKHLGIYLQCNYPDNQCWSCNAYFELRLVSTVPDKTIMRKARNTFTPQNNDWGFTEFIHLEDLRDESNGFYECDSIVIEVKVIADAPHGIQWDSKKYTNYIGLKNQGATCYMNSILQTLFCTNLFRKIVYKIPTECDEIDRSVALALQRVFFNLQFSDKPVGTQCLTKSFGWDSVESFMQHDIQEFLRVLMDKLENKIRETTLNGSLQRLFQGKMLSYIRCKNVDVTSHRIEQFYDIQLNVKGNKCLYDSFKNYIRKEELEGDNKYDAGKFGLQDAEKGVIFLTLPPVLYLHLMRFEYDPETDTSIKSNDRFEFDEEIDMKEFLIQNKTDEDIENYENINNFLKNNNNNRNNNMDCDDNINNNNDDTATTATKTESTTPTTTDISTIYKLHAVLVHSGDNHSGHYVVYIDPKLDGNWCKFDDDVVSKCSKIDAINRNFGGLLSSSTSKNNDKNDDNSILEKENSNAYMLVYINQSEIDNILSDVNKDDIPDELVKRIKLDELIEMNEQTIENEKLLYTNIYILLEEYVEYCDSVGIVDGLILHNCQEFRFLKTQFITDLKDHLSKSFIIEKNHFRLWIYNENNQIVYLNYIDFDRDGDKKFLTYFKNQTQLVYLEILNKYKPLHTTDDEGTDNNQMIINDTFDCNNEILVFIKHYDPLMRISYYVCNQKFSYYQKVQDTWEILNEELQKNGNVKYYTYVERGNNGIRILDNNDTFEKVIKTLQIRGHGLIFVLYEMKPNDKNNDNNGKSMIMSDNDDISIFNDSSDSVSNISNLSTSNAQLSCEEYYYNILHKIQIHFLDKNNLNVAGFDLDLCENDTYEVMAKKVAKQIETDPDKLQFYKSQFNSFISIFRSHKHVPGNPILYMPNRLIKDIFPSTRTRLNRRIYYERLPMNIDELENKVDFKVLFVSLDLKNFQEFTLYLNRNDTVRDLLNEASKYYRFDKDGTHRLRIVTMYNSKIDFGPSHGMLVEALKNTQNISAITYPMIYRIEEIPKNELSLEENESLIPVTYVTRETLTQYGMPFFIKIKNGEKISDIKNHIKARLNIQKKEMEKYRVIVAHNKILSYTLDDETFTWTELDEDLDNLPEIVLEFNLRGQKRATSSEKAVKIYNG